MPFHYAGIVKEFPTAPKDSFFVANADYVAKATGSDASVDAYLLDTGGTTRGRSPPGRAPRSAPSATVTDITQARGTVGSSLTSVDLAGLTRIELGLRGRPRAPRPAALVLGARARRTTAHLRHRHRPRAPHAVSCAAMVLEGPSC